MTRYIALLRGINISGKNKIAISELKDGISALGFSDVKTYLNSGNAVFSSDITDKAVLSGSIKTMISDRFCLDIPVFVISQEELKELLTYAPDWWGTDNKDIYDNLIFMLPPLCYDELLCEIGSPKAEYENVSGCKDAVFWSFSRKDYQRTNWWSKTASSSVSNQITIRTANTVRKLADM